MAIKYIPDAVAQKIVKEVKKVQKYSERPVKEGEVIKLLILKGISSMTAEDWKRELNR